MTKSDWIRTLCAGPLLVALSLAGCATPAAKDFGGSWKPVNHFQNQTTEIPLEQAYSFYGSPMDGTLKTMLSRWAKDTKMTLSYQLTSDFTLYQPVSKIQTSDVRSAAAELSKIYAAEGVLVTINDKQILVSVADVSKPDASEKKQVLDAVQRTASDPVAGQASPTSPTKPASTTVKTPDTPALSERPVAALVPVPVPASATSAPSPPSAERKL